MTKFPRTLSETVVHKNPYMHILKQHLRYPDSRERDYFVLDRKNDFSIVIPLFEDGTTMLVGQYRVPIRKFSWEFAMGTVDGKTALGVAKQELKEETGLTAKTFVKIGEFFVAPGYAKQKATVYIAKNLTLGNPSPEPYEELTLRKVSLDSITKMIKNGTIKDGPSLVAYFFLMNYLNSQ